MVQISGGIIAPSRRRELAQKAVNEKDISIRLSCELFSISETCYRYEAKLDDENAQIADWLLRLTSAQRNWGFGLCFLYLRNVKHFRWNHKRVYRIYRELELNLRIFIQPGNPQQNAYVERYNRTVRYDWLNQYVT